jgi:AcrR family transcriptional regulator
MSRKDEILDAFEKLVARFGLDKVTMQDIAREVGISVGAIYLDYANKDAIIQAIEERWQHQIEGYNRKIIESKTDPEDKIYQLIVAHIDQMSQRMRKDRALLELLAGSMRIKYTGKKMKSMRHEIKETMSAGVAECLKEGCAQNRFHLHNPDFTARLLVDAFAEYFSPHAIMGRQHGEVMRDVKGMYDLIMKAIKAGA